MCGFTKFVQRQGDFILRKFALTFNHLTKKRRDRTEVRDILHLTNSNPPN